MSRAKNMGLPVLVAESSSYYVSLIRDWLSDAGYGDIEFCATVEQARAMATEQKYGAIVIDARLQDGSGIMLAREIRHAPHSPNRMTPMVLLDCRSTRRRVSAARDGGASEYVCKPMSRKSFTAHFLKAVSDGRSFIKARGYFGPDRRRRASGWDGADRRRQAPRRVRVEEGLADA
jgi:two-component system chemotaxis response regulator CheY